MNYPNLKDVIKSEDWQVSGRDKTLKKEVKIGDEVWNFYKDFMYGRSGAYCNTESYVVTNALTRESLVVFTKAESNPDISTSTATIKLDKNNEVVKLSYHSATGAGITLECSLNESKKKMIKLLLKKESFIMENPLMESPHLVKYAFNHLRYQLSKKDGYTEYLRFDNVILSGDSIGVLVDILIIGRKNSYLNYSGEKLEISYNDILGFNHLGTKCFWASKGLGFDDWNIREMDDCFKIGCYHRGRMSEQVNFRIRDRNKKKKPRVIKVQTKDLDKYIVRVSKNKQRKLGLLK